MARVGLAFTRRIVTYGPSVAGFGLHREPVAAGRGRGAAAILDRRLTSGGGEMPKILPSPCVPGRMPGGLESPAVNDVTEPPRRSEWVLLAALLIAAAALRVFLALTTPGWFAEIFILRVAAMPLADALRLAAADINPPLQFVLRWAWSLAGGTGVVWHKLFSILFALVAIGLSFALARRVLGARAAFFMLALLTVHAAHAQFSQEIEEYSLEWALVAGMMLCGWRWIEARKAGDAALYVACAWLASINHYESLVVIAIVAVSGLVALAREPRALLAWLGLHLVVAAAFAPFAPVMLSQLARESGGRFFAFPSTAALAGVWRTMGFVSRYALLPLLVLSLVPLARRDTRRFALFVWPLLLFAPFATRFWVVILPREVLFMLPLWLMLAAAGLAQVRPTALQAVLLAGLLGLGLRGLRPLPRYPETLETRRAEFMLAPAAPRGALVLHAETHSLLYFAQYRPEYRNRILMAPGAHLPFFEGGLAIPDSLYMDYDAWRRERAAGVPWWGVRIDRALATRGQVWRAGEAAAESLAAAGDTLWRHGPITVWKSRTALAP